MRGLWVGRASEGGGRASGGGGRASERVGWGRKSE